MRSWEQPCRAASRVHLLTSSHPVKLSADRLRLTVADPAVAEDLEQLRGRRRVPLEAVVEEHFDMVVIDMALTDMSPITLVQAIREAKNNMNGRVTCVTIRS